MIKNLVITHIQLSQDDKCLRRMMDFLLKLFSNVESLQINCLIHTREEFDRIVPLLLKNLKKLTYLSLTYRIHNITKDHCLELMRNNMIDTDKINIVVGSYDLGFSGDEECVNFWQ
ncbi:unnamed protein product [Didymodactylos carnosus]|uniref:Uncharacterized protein n=1 Tax=Didymodactylos carnosus TaxID=1234261 RepID=A0A8S2VUN7_9BILA|nr:unnamed protein product [Didymodactylos carnosus]CAF4418300.1 unnamed protein product [Didymodactylos carnosus]